MILYTVMPLELVFSNQGHTSEESLYESVYMGRRVLARVTAGGVRQVVRLYSSNPSDYLDPRFCPGAEIGY